MYGIGSSLRMKLNKFCGTSIHSPIKLPYVEIDIVIRRHLSASKSRSRHLAQLGKVSHEIFKLEMSSPVTKDRVFLLPLTSLPLVHYSRGSGVETAPTL